MTDERKTATEEDVAQNGTTWLGGNIFWGGLILLTGLLFLLSNFGMVAIHWEEIWRLWPIAIIVAGLSFLSLRGWVAAVIYGVAAIVIVALIWATLTGAFASGEERVNNQSFSVNEPGVGIEHATVAIAAGGASLNISSTDSDDVVQGESEGRRTRLQTQPSTSEGRMTVRLSQERDSHLMLPGAFGKMDVRLTQSLPLDLEIDAGATSINADLSEVMLRSLLIDSGASSIDVKLGDRLDSSDITIDTGVSSVAIRVPEEVGVRLVLDAGLSSKNLPDGYEQLRDDTYQSPGFDVAAKQISINVDMGVSSFTLSTY